MVMRKCWAQSLTCCEPRAQRCWGRGHCWEAVAKAIASTPGTGRASVWRAVPGKVLFKASSPEAPVSSTRSPHILPSLNQHKKQQFNSPPSGPSDHTAIPAGLRTCLHSCIHSLTYTTVTEHLLRPGAVLGPEAAQTREGSNGGVMGGQPHLKGIGSCGAGYAGGKTKQLNRGRKWFPFTHFHSPHLYLTGVS